MIHTVKGFSVADEQREMFFWNSLAFSITHRTLAMWSLKFLFLFETQLDIWKFLVCIMLKPSMQDFKHDLTSMGQQCNCPMVSTFFGTTLLGNWDEDWSFRVLWPMFWSERYSILFWILTLLSPLLRRSLASLLTVHIIEAPTLTSAHCSLS